jgi:hypothetical protein
MISASINRVLLTLNQAWFQVDGAHAIDILYTRGTPEAAQAVNALLPKLTEALEDVLLQANYTAGDLAAWNEGFERAVRLLRRLADQCAYPRFPGHVYAFMVATGISIRPPCGHSLRLYTAVLGAGELGYLFINLERGRARRRRFLGAALRGESPSLYVCRH